jgi:hypothetical protein
MMRAATIGVALLISVLGAAQAQQTPQTPLRIAAMAEAEPALSIYLVPEAAQPSSGYADLRGTLRIKWGMTEWTTSWRVDQ